MAAPPHQNSISRVQQAPPPHPLNGPVVAPPPRRQRQQRNRRQGDDTILTESFGEFSASPVANRYVERPSRNRRRSDVAYLIPYDSASLALNNSKRAIMEAAEFSTTPPTKPAVIIFAKLDVDGRCQGMSPAAIGRWNAPKYRAGGSGRVLNPFMYFERQVYWNHSQFVYELGRGFDAPKIIVGKKTKASSRVPGYLQKIRDARNSMPNSILRKQLKTELMTETIRHNNVLREK